MYIPINAMDVSITKFRREIFDLVSQALDGTEVWVTYKGRRFRIAAEDQPAGRLARITPLEVINPEKSHLEGSLQEEMAHAWEKDWTDL